MIPYIFYKYVGDLWFYLSLNSYFLDTVHSTDAVHNKKDVVTIYPPSVISNDEGGQYYWPPFFDFYGVGTTEVGVLLKRGSILHRPPLLDPFNFTWVGETPPQLNLFLFVISSDGVLNWDPIFLHLEYHKGIWAYKNFFKISCFLFIFLFLFLQTQYYLFSSSKHNLYWL